MIARTGLSKERMHTIMNHICQLVCLEEINKNVVKWKFRWVNGANIRQQENKTYFMKKVYNIGPLID